MRKFLFYLFMFALGLALLIFLVANRQPVTVSLDPFSASNPAVAIGPVPLWSAMIAPLLLGYLLGGLGMWISAKGTRRKASERKREIRRLQREVAATANAARKPQETETLPAVTARPGQ